MYVLEISGGGGGREGGRERERETDRVREREREIIQAYLHHRKPTKIKGSKHKIVCNILFLFLVPASPALCEVMSHYLLQLLHEKEGKVIQDYQLGTSTKVVFKVVWQGIDSQGIN